MFYMIYTFNILYYYHIYYTSLIVANNDQPQYFGQSALASQAQQQVRSDKFNKLGHIH